MPVCLAVAQVLVALLPTDAFSLAWTHSVERTEWREEWEVEGDQLRLVRATVAGSGAGMEPPPEAERDGAGWSYATRMPPVATVLLAASSFGGDYRVCWQHDCHSLGDLPPPGAARPAALTACRTGSTRGRPSGSCRSALPASSTLPCLSAPCCPFGAQGNEVRLMSPEYVRPYVKAQEERRPGCRSDRGSGDTAFDAVRSGEERGVVRRRLMTIPGIGAIFLGGPRPRSRLRCGLRDGIRNRRPVTQSC